MKFHRFECAYVFFAVAIGMIAWERNAPGDEPSRRNITLSIDGVSCESCARALSSALSECHAELLRDLEPNADRPSRVEVSCPLSFDLAACAGKLSQVQPPSTEGRTSTLDLILFAKIDEQSAREALTACHRINGIDGASSKADIIKGELHIRILGNKTVTPEQIVHALRELGIVAQFTKSNPALTNT